MDKVEDENYSTYKDGTMVDYMHNLDKLSFADVMQFADFGPKLKGLNQISKNNICEDHDIDQETAGIEMIDPVYFLKFPVLNDDNDNKGDPEEYDERDGDVEGGHGVLDRFLDHKNVPIGGAMDMMMNVNEGGKNKRKRARSVKTSEEVESQRMTHIAVERNRRKQMNEHLRVLRSLMPGSYVQRGDQASIIGGAIEFVRELEQLLECLESQKRRRLYGEGGPPVTRQIAGDTNTIQQFPPFETSAGGSFQEEETAENKSCFADVEVKLLGFDAVIKILCRRRPGQLVTTIAALQDLQLNILHTNITTIEQTVLYSFNVKVGNEMRFTAEDIANSVQQIFSFIHANTSM